MLADGINLFQSIFVGISRIFDVTNLSSRNAQYLTHLCLTDAFVDAKLFDSLDDFVLVFKFVHDSGVILIMRANINSFVCSN